MSQRIALRCPSCHGVSYRPAGFVLARAHFVCNYCHELGKISRRELVLARARHRAVVDVEPDALELDPAGEQR